MLICREICFVAIYAVLAQNLFCRDLRTFVWRKIYSEIVLVEKKGQISGMHFVGPNILHELPDNAVESSSGEGEKCEILGLTNMKSVREKSIFFDLVLFSANGG